MRGKQNTLDDFLKTVQRESVEARSREYAAKRVVVPRRVRCSS